MNFNRIRLCLNPKHDSSTGNFTLLLWQSQNVVAKSQCKFQQVLNLCYVKLPNFSIMGLTDILLSFATVLQPPNVFRFSSQLCLNGRQLLRSENRFFFIFILKHHYTALQRFPYFQISIASFTYFMTMPQTHVICAPLMSMPHTTCHIVKCLYVNFN